jgi:hypothetical protein
MNGSIKDLQLYSCCFNPERRKETMAQVCGQFILIMCMNMGGYVSTFLIPPGDGLLWSFRACASLGKSRMHFWDGSTLRSDFITPDVRVMVGVGDVKFDFQGVVCIAGGNKMAWYCIGLDYNAYWYICIVTYVGGWWLAGVTLCWGFPLKLHREFLFWDFHGHGVRIVVCRGALHWGLTVLFIQSIFVADSASMQH